MPPRTRKVTPVALEAESPAMAQSDEGVPYLSQDADTLINRADRDDSAARVPRLHVSGRAYEHVAEDAEGRWVYRYDR